MKRVAAAVVLLAVAAGISVWSGYVFQSRMDCFEKELSLLLDAPDSELSSRTQKIAELWEEHGDFLHSVFIHEGIDELEMLIVHLEKLQSFSQIQHTSLLVNKIKHSADNIAKHTDEPLGHFYWRHLNRVLADAYASVKDSPRDVAIKERLAAL